MYITGVILFSTREIWLSKAKIDSNTVFIKSHCISFMKRKKEGLPEKLGNNPEKLGNNPENLGTIVNLPENL